MTTDAAAVEAEVDPALPVLDIDQTVQYGVAICWHPDRDDVYRARGGEKEAEAYRVKLLDRLDGPVSVDVVCRSVVKIRGPWEDR